MEQHVCGSSNPVAEVRGSSCGALDLEFEAEKEVAHVLHFQCDLRQVASLLARDPIPTAARSLTSAGLCVSFHGHHQSMNE